MIDDPTERESINMLCSIDGLSVSADRRDEEWCSIEVLVSPTNNDRMRPGNKGRAHDCPANWLDTREHHFPRSETDDVRPDRGLSDWFHSVRGVSREKMGLRHHGGWCRNIQSDLVGCRAVVMRQLHIHPLLVLTFWL